MNEWEILYYLIYIWFFFLDEIITIITSGRDSLPDRLKMVMSMRCERCLVSLLVAVDPNKRFQMRDYLSNCSAACLSGAERWSGLYMIDNSLFNDLLSTTTSKVCSLQPVTDPAFLISLFILLVSPAPMLLPHQSSLCLPQMSDRKSPLFCCTQKK